MQSKTLIKIDLKKKKKNLYEEIFCTISSVCALEQLVIVCDGFAIVCGSSRNCVCLVREYKQCNEMVGSGQKTVLKKFLDFWISESLDFWT